MAVEVNIRSIYPYAAITLLVVTFPDGHKVVGSGAIVGPNDVLTAAHVIYSPDHGGRASTITVYPGADFNGTTAQIEDAPYKVDGFVSKADTWFEKAFADSNHAAFSKGESQYDVAIVGLSTPVGTQTGWFKLSSGFNTSQWASVAGYSSGMPGLMAGKAWVERDLSTSTYFANERVGTDLLGPGSSGGPLYIVGVDGEPYIIGVKSSGNTSNNIWADIGLQYDQLTAAIARNDSLLSGVYLNNFISDADATVGRSFVFALGEETFKNGSTTGPLIYTARLTNGNALPEWLKFDGATRTFSGMPISGTGMTIDVRVTAHGADATIASDDFRIAIGSAGMQYTGTAGGERIVAQLGNDLIDGGDGIDTVVFSDERAVYKVKAGAMSSVTVKSISGDSGADVLDNIERLQFADMSLAFDIEGNAGKAFRLYHAAFDRMPDQAGLGFWINALDMGNSLQNVAGGFIGSNEFKTLYGSNPTNVELLTRFYQNVLHRAPDTDGFDWWLAAMNQGVATPTQTLIDFSESAENKAQVIGSIKNGIEYQFTG